MTPYTNSQIRDDVAKLNQRLRLRQRIGLWLLMLSFVCSLVHAIIE